MSYYDKKNQPYKNYYANPGSSYSTAGKDVVRVTETANSPKVEQIDPRITQRQNQPAYTPPTNNNDGGNNSGGGTAMVQSNPYESYYNKMISLYEKQMADEKARQERVRKARIDAANKVYDNSLANLNDARDSSLRQAYIKHMQEQKALPQQMQAFGINGGATETNLANMKNVYGTNRANIMNEALEQQRYLEQDRANAIASAEGDAANYEASAVREYNDGLLNLYASALGKNYSTASGGTTGTIRNNQWYKQATSLLEDGNNRDEVIAYLDQNGVSEEIIDAILNDWDSSF